MTDALVCKITYSTACIEWAVKRALFNRCTITMNFLKRYTRYNRPVIWQCPTWLTFGLSHLLSKRGPINKVYNYLRIQRNPSMLFYASLLDWLGYFDTLPKPIPKSNLWGWSQEGLVSIKGYGPSVDNAIPDSKLVPKMGNHPVNSSSRCVLSPMWADGQLQSS